MRQLKRIKNKLNNLKAIDIDFEIFGSEGHKYKFNSTLTESEILDFEKKYNLVLPDGYKSFLMEVGNGGAGPFYGLLSLYDNEGESVNLDYDFGFDLENPCLLQKYNFYDEKIENAETENEEQELWDLKDSLINEDYQNAKKGITFLCHEGCGMYSVLVLKGKESGTVWWFNFSDDVGVLPILFKKKKVNFLDWYEMWLDKSLEFIENDYEEFLTFGN